MKDKRLRPNAATPTTKYIPTHSIGFLSLRLGLTLLLSLALRLRLSRIRRPVLIRRSASGRRRRDGWRRRRAHRNRAIERMKDKRLRPNAATPTTKYIPTHSIGFNDLVMDDAEFGTEAEAFADQEAGIDKEERKRKKKEFLVVGLRNTRRNIQILFSGVLLRDGQIATEELAGQT
jgi:hypothetical protein